MTIDERARQFLAQIGITEITVEDFSERYDQELKNHGLSWDMLGDITDTMGPEVMNLPFVSEVAAIETLGRNFGRIVEAMARLAEHDCQADTRVHRVAEFGGGSGVLSLWLASLNPRRHYDVFDHALNPLKIGQLWAKRLGISQVHFHHLSHAQLTARTDFSKYDWIICEHSVDLSSYPEIWEGDEATQKSHQYFEQRYRELASAIHHLLTTTGIASFHSGSVPPWSLRLLCNAFRDNKLFFDWSKSSNSDGLCLTVCHDSPEQFKSVTDEVLALLTQAAGDISLHPAYGRALEDLFGLTADCPFDVRVRDEDSIERRYRIVQRGGLALLICRASSGDERTTLTSAANIPDLVRTCHADTAESTIIDKKISDALLSLL